MILRHWEDFFQRPSGDEPNLIRLTNSSALRTRLQGVLGDTTRWTTPVPGASVRFALPVPGN